MRMLLKSLAAATLFAACVNTQPLTAQTTAKDSLAKALATAKARVDSTNELSTTPLAQWCRSYNSPGYLKNGSCLWQSPLLSRTQAALAEATLIASKLTTRVDTVRIVRVDTVRIPVPSPTPTPAPVVVASVSTSLADRTLTPGDMTTAKAIVKDSSGAVLTSIAPTWSSAAPTVASVSSAGLVTAVSPGTSQIKATVDGKSSYATLTVLADTARTPDPTPTPTPPVDTTKPPAIVNIGPPELPRVSLNTAITATPSTGRTLTVNAGGNLQAALDSAKAGDRLLLASGAVFTGNFTLPAKASGSAGWITVQSNTTLPAEGTRMTPSAATGLASIRTPNVLPALATASSAARWRIVGIDVTVVSGVTANQGLVLLGDGSSAQSVTATIPRNIILDRMYIHGTPTLDMRRCVALNSDSTAVIDSYVSECHSIGFDAQAVWGWNGNGPYKITNNYLEASTEIVGFGGADPAVPNLVPSDIEIRGNHMTRPLTWKGGPWLVKNLVELKNARRVLIDGNVMENSWPNGQLGWAFVLWSVNQSGTCSWCIVSDVTISKNLIRNVAAGFQLTDRYGTVAAPPMQRVAIRDNVVIGMANALVGDGGYGFLIQGTVPGLIVEHNTMFNPRSTSWMWPAGAAPIHQTIRNNLTGGCGPYQVSMQGPWTVIADTASRFASNVITCFDNYAGYLPAGNLFPTSLAGVGLAGGASAAYSVTATLDSLALSATSPFKGKGTDGKDIGADIAAVKAATAGVVQSVPLGARRPIPIRKP